MRDYLRSQVEVEPVNAVGVRAAESKARSNLPEWEVWRDTNSDVWRPLLHWSEQDVIDIHHRHNVTPNPLYLKGASRVGCWPCIFARKAEIRLLAKIDPERIDRIERLEAEVAKSARERYEARGETFDSLGYECPHWFQNPSSRTNLKHGKKAGAPWPIRMVVDWSRTTRGGKQIELFDPPENDGCMRWGLCEATNGQD